VNFYAKMMHKKDIAEPILSKVTWLSSSAILGRATKTTEKSVNLRGITRNIAQIRNSQKKQNARSKPSTVQRFRNPYG
jgi:hypothetical protein